LSVSNIFFITTTELTYPQISTLMRSGIIY